MNLDDRSGRLPEGSSLPLIITTILPEEGRTGVHTHMRQLRSYLQECGVGNTLLTPYTWSRFLAYPVFAPRRLLEPFSGAASVAWYRHWHGILLASALRRHLAAIGDCVVYAQGPVDAGAALRVRKSAGQRVVMAVHFSVSDTETWAASMREKGPIRRDGKVFRAIRKFESEVIPQLDGIVYVSEWARDALIGWLPEAKVVPSTVIGNFVAPFAAAPRQKPLADLVTVGNLDRVKNHRFLLEVLAEAKRVGRSFTLDVFGDGALRKDLLQHSHQLGVEQQVRFRGFRPDVRRFLPCYRAYVHASHTETFCLAIVEAMAAGLPIVTGAVGAIPELCDDGVEARFWPLDDAAGAARTLIDFLDCESAVLATAAAASRRFHRYFDASVIAPRLWAFLQGSDLQIDFENSHG